jgi:hypothetical protein
MPITELDVVVMKGRMMIQKLVILTLLGWIVVSLGCSCTQAGSGEILTPNVNWTTQGYIVKDEIWRDEIHIVGDIFVDEGVTLTIEPGTVVRIAANQDQDNLFDEPFEMKQGIQNEVENINGVHRGEPYRDEGNHISIRISGTLHAVGTLDQMITITSDSPTPGRYDWNRFEFSHGILSYSVVEYYRILSPGNGTEVSHNVLQNIGECGVCANSTVLIQQNTISHAGHELIDMHGTSPTIRNNRLGPNPDRAGIVIDGGSPQILDNTIEGCEQGIIFISPEDAPTIEGNGFSNNWKDIMYAFDEVIPGDISEFQGAVGKWESVDSSDGSNQTLSVNQLSIEKYSINYFDEQASICGQDSNGNPIYAAEGEGQGVPSNLKLQVTLDFVCIGDPEENSATFSVEFTYDPASDVITDSFSNLWNRVD